MQKILLILEDYSELMFIQIILKKLGFDVDGIQNPHAISDRLLAFHPQVVIAPEEGKRVKKEFIKQTLLTQTPALRVVLLSATASGIEEVRDGVVRIKNPIQPTDLIRALSQLCQLDGDALVAKYQKFRKQLPSGPDGGAFRGESLPEDPERADRYKAFLEKASDSVEKNFGAEEVQAYHRKLRQVTVEPSSVDVDRQRFVKNLFRKKG